MITRQRDLDDLCGHLAVEEVVGVDTEYVSDRRFFPDLCLIQVAGDSVCAAIDPMAGLDLTPLRPVLDGSGPVVVMHGVQNDAPLLARAVGCRFGKVFDTMIAAGFLGTGQLSLASLVQRFLGVELAKAATLTDWARRPLPDAAVRYAIEDVAHLPALWRALVGRLLEKGRELWVDEEVHLVLRRSLSPPDPATAWRRLENNRRLKGAALAVAVEVAAWRLRTAMAVNRPVKRVMGDLAVLAVAESKPTTVEALKEARGVDRGLVREFGEDIVAAVRSALSSDPASWPRPPSPPPPDLATIHDALGLAARMVAREVGIAPSLAYTRDDLIGLAEDPPRGRLTEGWRADVVAPPLLELLAGKAALTVEDRGLRLARRP